MMFVDFQQEGRPVVRCLFGAGPVPEACSSSFFGEIDPRPAGLFGNEDTRQKQHRKSEREHRYHPQYPICLRASACMRRKS